jgi:hypothetical protein
MKDDGLWAMIISKVGRCKWVLGHILEVRTENVLIHKLCGVNRKENYEMALMNRRNRCYL